MGGWARSPIKVIVKADVTMSKQPQGLEEHTINDPTIYPLGSHVFSQESLRGGGKHDFLSSGVSQLVQNMCGVSSQCSLLRSKLFRKEQGLQVG